jgi:hypothetical protein
MFCIGAVTGWLQPACPIKVAMYISIAYLGLGLLFLFFKDIRLMMLCLGCSAAISLLLQEIQPDFPPRPEKAPLSMPLVPHDSIH